MAKGDITIETAGDIQVVSVRIQGGANDPYSPWNKHRDRGLEAPKTCKDCLYYGRVCPKGCRPR